MNRVEVKSMMLQEEKSLLSSSSSLQINVEVEALKQKCLLRLAAAFDSWTCCRVFARFWLMP